MPEPLPQGPRQPDDRAFFEQHPDIRTLQGVGTGESAGFAAALGEQSAASLELFAEAPVLVDYANIPVGGELHVVSGKDADKPEEFVFVRTGAGGHTEDWVRRVIIPESEGGFLDMPVQIEGSATNHSHMMRLGAVLRGANLVYRTVQRAVGTSGADFADSDIYAALPHVAELSPNAVSMHLESGFMVLGVDGKPVYNAPVVIDPQTVESVTDAWVVPPETQVQGKPSIET